MRHQRALNCILRNLNFIFQVGDFAQYFDKWREGSGRRKRSEVVVGDLKAWDQPLRP